MYTWSMIVVRSDPEKSSRETPLSRVASCLAGASHLTSKMKAACSRCNDEELPRHTSQYLLLLFCWLPSWRAKLRERLLHRLFGQTRIKIEPNVTFNDRILDVIKGKLFVVTIAIECISNVPLRTNLSRGIVWTSWMRDKIVSMWYPARR
jgi:hypothetical protein